MPKISVKYQNATAANYLYQVSKVLGTIAQGHSHAFLDDWPDLKLSRIDTDLGLLQDKALITVNGIVHSTVYNGENFWIVNGAKSMVKFTDNHVGILSFMGLQNNLLKYAFSQSMITPDLSFPLYEKMYITAPDSISSLVLVLGGYIQLEEPGVLYRVSDASFALHLNKTNYIQRLYELYDYTNIFKSLDLTVSLNTDPLINVTDATSDATILKYMTLKSTFMVSVPTEELSQEKNCLSQNTRPGYFCSANEPTDCLINETGKILEYFKMPIGDSKNWEGSVCDWRYENYLLSSISKNKINIINSLVSRDEKIMLAGAHFLNLSMT